MIRDTLIRPAEHRDAWDIGRIYVESWRHAYQGILPKEYLDGLQPDQTALSVQRGLRSHQMHCLVAESEQGVLGYASAGPARGNDPVYSAELYELYLLPDAQHQGLGRQLLSKTARQLFQAHHYTLIVWVLTRNLNRHFYEKCNGLYLHTRPITFAGSALQADAYGWIDITLAVQDESAGQPDLKPD